MVANPTTLTLTYRFRSNEPEIGDVYCQRVVEISGPDIDGDVLIEVVTEDGAGPPSMLIYVDAASLPKLIAELQARVAAQAAAQKK